MPKRNASRFAQVFNTEVRIACRSWTIHWLSWCWSLLLFDVISGVYQVGTLLDIPPAVVDRDHSQLSRKLIRDSDATSHTQVIAAPTGVQEGLDAVRRAGVYALLYILPDFETDVLGGCAPKAEPHYNALLCSASYTVTQDFSVLVVSLNDELRPRLAAGMLMALLHPANISVSYDNLFNTSNNYIYYQQFATIVYPLQLLVIVTVVHVLARRAPELRASSSHILRAKVLGVYLMGKLAPYTLLFTALLMLEIFPLVTFSGTRVNDNPLVVLMVTLFYVTAAQSVGLALFAFTTNCFTAYSPVDILIGVVQTYSGMLVLELAMPTLARVITEAEPLTHTLHDLLDQFLRQASPSSALYTYTKLALYPLTAYMIAKMYLHSRLDLSPI